MGDLGQTANSEQTLEHMAASGAASVLNVGDLSYADGEQPRWDSYGRLVQVSAAAVPQMTIEVRGLNPTVPVLSSAIRAAPTKTSVVGTELRHRPATARTSSA